MKTDNIKRHQTCQMSLNMPSVIKHVKRHQTCQTTESLKNNCHIPDVVEASTENGVILFVIYIYVISSNVNIK